ncbi:MAG: hypothetical protein H6Q15_1773 [Bacteroidetes bacterium]|nr:hypothetical protein [Bacteroidota bacterium]
MSINKINNGDSFGKARGIINEIVDNLNQQSSYATTEQVNQGLSSKQDKEAGKGLYPNTDKDKLAGIPSLVYSKTETDSAIAVAVSASSGKKISFTRENINGQLEYVSNAGVLMQNIYTKIVTFDVLPDINTLQEAEISSDMLDDDVYCVVENFFATNTNGSLVNCSGYFSFSVEKGFGGLNRLFIEGLKDITGMGFTKGYCQVSYLKYYGEKIEINLKVPTAAEANSLDCSIPPLKFDKEVAVSFTADDADASAYCVLFSAINNRPIYYDGYYHHNQYLGNDLPEGSVRLNKYLGFRDGNGVFRRFPIGMAVWANKKNGQGINQMDTEAEVGNNQYRYMLPYLNWEDIKPMLEFGNSVYQHNVNEEVYGSVDPEQILQGFILDQQTAINRIGRGFKVMARPDGNDSYTNAFDWFNEFLLATGENDPYIGLKPFEDGLDLYKARAIRYFDDPPTVYQANVTTEMAKAKEERIWLHQGVHRAGTPAVDMLEWYDSHYGVGSGGNDVMWFTTLDEFYEYWLIRKRARIIKTVNGTDVKFEVYIPKGQYFYYPEFTLKFNQNIDKMGNTVVFSNNVIGVSINNTPLININTDVTLLQRAEKYVSRYEMTGSNYDREDAYYFVNMLMSSLAEPFLARIGAVSTDLSGLNILGVDSVVVLDTLQLGIAYIPSITTQTGVTWSSSDDSIAAVDNNGLVTAKVIGNVTITATSVVNPAISTTKQLSIISEAVPVDGIIINGSSAVDVGNTLQLSVTYTPSDTTEQGVTWSSSNNGIATVNSNGLVTAIAAGNVTISATSTFRPMAVVGQKNITVSEVVAAKPTAIIKDSWDGATTADFGLFDYTRFKVSTVSRINTASNKDGDTRQHFYDQDGNIMGIATSFETADLPLRADGITQYGENDYDESDVIADTSNHWFNNPKFYTKVRSCKFEDMGKTLVVKLQNLAAGIYTVRLWASYETSRPITANDKIIVNGITYSHNQNGVNLQQNYGTLNTKPIMIEYTDISISAGVLKLSPIIVAEQGYAPMRIGVIELVFEQSIPV